jgi:hypothetical protein
MIFARILTTIAVLGLAFPASAQPEQLQEPEGEDSRMSVQSLVKDGWQIAGYASNCDARSTFILFRRPGENDLVQCLVGYDVTRTPRIFHNCYRLH